MSNITAETLEKAECHATDIELFLDLVFVFAITQIASLNSYHPRVLAPRARLPTTAR